MIDRPYWLSKMPVNPTTISNAAISAGPISLDSTKARLIPSYRRRLMHRRISCSLNSVAINARDGACVGETTGNAERLFGYPVNKNRD
jgi:hypothetical protein